MSSMPRTWGTLIGMLAAGLATAQVCAPGPSPVPHAPHAPHAPRAPRGINFVPGRSPPYYIPNAGYGFSGIGAVPAQVDLLTYPASQRAFPAALPTFSNGGCYVAPPCPTPYYAPTSYSNGYGTSAYVSTGSGLTVNGRYSGDKWKVGFHLGSSPVEFVNGNCGPIYQPPICNYPLWGWRTSYGSYWGDYYPYSTYPVGPNTYGNDPRLWQNFKPPATTQPAEPPAPPTAFELGKAALDAKQPRYAIEAFRRALKEDGQDPIIMRYLAIALAENKQFDDAAAVMSSAYKLSPGLATDPIDLAGLGYTERSFREFTARCVRAANSNNTGSSWILVTALMQAEGRNDTAKRTLQKAKALGVESDVIDSLEASLAQ